MTTQAKVAGNPVTLITDPYREWGHSIADEVFVVPTSFNLLWAPTAQVASLATPIVNGVLLELGPQVEAYISKIAQLYGRFTGYVDKPRHKSPSHKES